MSLYIIQAFHLLLTLSIIVISKLIPRPRSLLILSGSSMVTSTMVSQAEEKLTGQMEEYSARGIMDVKLNQWAEDPINIANHLALINEINIVAMITDCVCVCLFLFCLFVCLFNYFPIMPLRFLIIDTTL